MHKLIYFLKKTYVPILFVLIEIGAICLYADSSPYSQARTLAASHYIAGWGDRLFGSMRSYLSLRRDNIALTERIAELESRLNAYKQMVPDNVEVELELDNDQYIACKVVSNSINHLQNYIIINKGLNDGVRIGMSVLTAQGYAVGSITNCTENFSVAASLLNTSVKVSARLSTDKSMGLFYWPGGDSQIALFSNVPKYAQIETGDMVEAIDFSEYFPDGTILGSVESAELTDDQTMYTCTVRLAADMSRLDNVILVDGHNIEQVKRLKREPIPVINAEDNNE